MDWVAVVREFGAGSAALLALCYALWRLGKAALTRLFAEDTGYVSVFVAAQVKLVSEATDGLAEMRDGLAEMRETAREVRAHLDTRNELEVLREQVIGSAATVAELRPILTALAVKLGAAGDQS